MSRILPLAGALLFTCLMCCGCNTVYFYETAKASFTIEARPDPTAPVTGNIGVKHRIAAVVPSTQPSTPESRRLEARATEQLAVAASPTLDAATTQAAADEAQFLQERAAELNRVAAGNAMSVLSSFRFHKHPPPRGSIISQVTIDATLITGNAARQLNSAQIDETVRALNGVQPAALGNVLASLVHLREALVKHSQNAPNSDAASRVTNLDAAAALLPPTYPIDVYELGGASGPLNRLHKHGDTVARAGFTDVTSYLGELSASGAALLKAAEISESGNAITIDGSNMPATPDRLVANGLRHLASRTAELHAQAVTEVNKSPAIRAEAKALGFD